MTYMRLIAMLLLLIPATGIAQTAKIDSLKRVIETTKVDTVKGRTLCRLCGELLEVGKYEESLETCKQGLKVSQKAKDLKGEGNCLCNMGNINLYGQDYPRALEFFQNSLKIDEKIGNREEMAENLGNIANIFLSRGDYSRALECHHRSLKIYQQIGNKAGIANILSYIGSIYHNQNDYNRAQDFYQRSLAICNEIGDHEGSAYNLNNIGIIFSDRGEFALALEHYQRSYNISVEIGDRSGEAKGLNNMGNVYKSQADNKRALECYMRSLKICEQRGDETGKASIYSNLSMIYLQLGRLDSASIYAKRGYELSQKVGHLHYKNRSAQALYTVDSALGNWKGAFEAARLFHTYSDSMKNDVQSKELGRLESKAEYDKQTEIDRLKNEEEKRVEAARNRWIAGSSLGFMLFVSILAFTLFRGRQKEQRANAALRTLNEEIQQQKSEIEAINTELQATLKEVNEQKLEIETQHEKIEDSIRYASRIQGAILPSTEQLKEDLPAHFIHYQPRDIVSGDFYWLSRHDGKTFFAAVDCTGHGVPGAFMSVLGSNLLHQIVDENRITEPDVILSELDRRISATLRQQFGGDSKDGMDLALVVVHEADENGRRLVEYAGAGRPLWIWSNGEIAEYQSAKYSCGGSQHKDKHYPAHRVEVRAGDRLYIFSDGPVDQFGGPKGRKLGSTQLQAFLTETANLPIEEQGRRFAAFFNDWMSTRKQLDDVLLAGVAV